MDAEGHMEDADLAKAVAAAKDHCNELHVLGSFPRATGSI